MRYVTSHRYIMATTHSLASHSEVGPKMVALLTEALGNAEARNKDLEKRIKGLESALAQQVRVAWSCARHPGPLTRGRSSGTLPTNGFCV